MDAREELLKITLGKIVTGVLLLVGFLAVVVWREALYKEWEQVAAGLSKQALLALLGLALITIAIEALSIAYLLYLVYRNRKASKSVPKSLRRYGIHWDKHQNPLCPVCEVLLSLRATTMPDTQPPEYLQCPKCRNAYTLKTDGGRYISLSLAKSNIRHAVARK